MNGSVVKPNPLDSAELVVLQALSRGHSIGRVTQVLGLDPTESRMRLRSVLKALEAETYLEAVIMAMREGWIPCPSECID